MAEKRCAGCKETKVLDAYSRDRSRPDGRQAQCKECDSKWNRAWRLANRDRKRATSRADYVKNRERVLARCRERYAADPGKKLAMARAWATANPEKINEASARRRAREQQAPRIEKIDREYVYKRDGGVCHICRRVVARRGFHLDHLVPLSKGGDHTHDNLAVAHPKCNASRRDGRIPAQLLLVG